MTYIETTVCDVCGEEPTSYTTTFEVKTMNSSTGSLEGTTHHIEQSCFDGEKSTFEDNLHGMDLTLYQTQDGIVAASGMFGDDGSFWRTKFRAIENCPGYILRIVDALQDEN